jgi:exodeoxyribonuclease VII small subunit
MASRSVRCYNSRIMTEEKSPTTSPSFETALEQLQQAVKRLESGELNLEQALQQFEEGVKLTRVCQEHLSSAEQRVELLMKSGSEASSPDLQPFTPQGRT